MPQHWRLWCLIGLVIMLAAQEVAPKAPQRDN